GNTTQDFNDPVSGARIDREPFILMFLILVRVQKFQNQSVAPPGVLQVFPAAPTSATGVGFTTRKAGGGGISAANAGMHQNAVATLIGGGRNGRLGLAFVFGGWINNVTRIA